MEKNENLSKINIRCILAYDGLTFSFDSEDIYDEYHLYEKGLKDPILKTTDFIVGGCHLEENKVYYVEGFKKEEEELVLKAKSEDTIPHPQTRKPIIGRPLISVVCPVYNAETCISNCIDSILCSTQEYIEIILVDDGSTDKSRDVIFWYVEHYNGIVKYIYQENQGVSFARNTGIKYAKGYYIGLIDNDDFVHPHMYEELLNAIRLSNAPVAIAKTLIKEPDGNQKICLNAPKKDNLKYNMSDYETMIRLKLKGDVNNIFFVAVWNKIIRADIVKKHYFPPFNYYEDTAYTRMIYSYINLFAFAFDAYYVWDQRRRNTVGTATTLQYKRKTDDVYEIHKKYFDAQLYGVEKGNPLQADWVVYDTIVELYDYLKKVKVLDPKNPLMQIIAKKLEKHFTKSYLLKNQYIKQVKEVKEFVESLDMR